MDMKGTLRKTSEGVIFTIDERPKIGDCYLSISKRMAQRFHKDDSFFSNQHKILASTFGVGLELWVKLKRVDTSVVFGGKFRPLNKLDEINFNTDHPYKIENNKVIIEL